MMNKILIVEDEESLLEALETKLKIAGFSTLRAKDGEQGLEVAKEESPDIILLDIIMPKMDGLTMLKHLRKDEKTKEIPVIILTNLVEGEKIEEAMANGTTDYLIKSNWKIEDVVKKIKERLEKVV